MFHKSNVSQMSGFTRKMYDKCHVSHVNCIVNGMFYIDNTYYTEAKLLSKVL